jgi:hypothetical protein
MPRPTERSQSDSSSIGPCQRDVLGPVVLVVVRGFVHGGLHPIWWVKSQDPAWPVSVFEHFCNQILKQRNANPMANGADRHGTEIKSRLQSEYGWNAPFTARRNEYNSRQCKGRC